MRGILEGFKYLYPCTHCRTHFQKDYDKGIILDDDRPSPIRQPKRPNSLGM